jgi:hypothetical protein
MSNSQLFHCPLAWLSIKKVFCNLTVYPGYKIAQRSKPYFYFSNMKKIISMILPMAAIVLLAASPALARRDHSEGDSDNNPQQIQLPQNSAILDTHSDEHGIENETNDDSAEVSHESRNQVLQPTSSLPMNFSDDHGNDDEHALASSTLSSSSSITVLEDSPDQEDLPSSTLGASTGTPATIDTNLTFTIAEIRRVLMQTIQNIIDALMSNTPSSN